MAERLTFLHTADLHIGAPLRGLRALSPEWADRLLRAVSEAYDRVIDAAVRNEVDFVVIAGDAFDTARPSYADYVRFFDGLRTLEHAGIPVYLCAGNHDPLTSWDDDYGSLPTNAHMFSADKPGFSLYERDGRPLCVLGGRSYYNQTWPGDVDISCGLTRAAANRALGGRACEAPFGVGVAHTGLHLDPRNAPVPLSSLLEAGFDYWALGHIHKKQLFPQENPRAGYPGCTQGRDINETGERGAYLVTLEQGQPNAVRFVPTASVVWQQLAVDVETCATLPEIVDRVLRELFRANGKAHCEEMCVRVTLTGATPLHALLAKPGVIDDMRANINGAYAEFFCDALVDRTVEPRDRASLAAEGLFPAIVMSVADAMRSDAPEQLSYLQDAFLERSLRLPQSDSGVDAARMIDRAESVVLDLIAKESS